jgi:predicted SAM-dependent methyltransferase
MKKLNLGCGRNIMQGYINADIFPYAGVDKIFDATKRFPFDDDTFDEVFASHFLEHFTEPEKILEEIHRVTKAGGEVKILTPHFTFHRAYELFHKCFFGYGAFDCFEEGQQDYFSHRRFKILKRKILFSQHSGFMKERKRNILTYLINKKPVIYERLFCWILPAREIHYLLTPIKTKNVQ